MFEKNVLTKERRVKTYFGEAIKNVETCTLRKTAFGRVCQDLNHLNK